MNKKSQAKRLQLWFGIVNILREALAKGHRRYIFASVGVHVLVVVLMSWSWHSSEAVKAFEIPSSVQARVLTAAEIDELPYKQRERKQILDEKLKKELALKKKKELELELKKKREQEKQRKLDADKKRKQEQDKKRILAEKKKAEALKAEKTKQELERKKQAAETKRLEQQKAEEAARKDAEVQDRVKKREQELEQLEAIAERREQALRDKLLADRLAAMKELNASANNAPVFDLDEKTRYLSIIKSRIESRWYVPPNSGRSYVVLRIQLLPSGELSSVKVIESSGNAALDQSALAAVRAVNKFEVPKEQRFFDEYFRSFQMSFKPPE